MKINVRQLGFRKFVKVNIRRHKTIHIPVRDESQMTVVMTVQNTDHTITELVFADLKEVFWIDDTMNVKVTV